MSEDVHGVPELESVLQKYFKLERSGNCNSSFKYKLRDRMRANKASNPKGT